MNYENPLIVQGDRTLLLDVHAPLAEECRNELIPFAELERSPEHLHTYRLSPLSLWNAASAGFLAQDAINVLQKYSRYDVPQSISMWISEISSRFGKLRLVEGPTEIIEKRESQTNQNDEKDEIIEEKYLYLVSNSIAVYKEIFSTPSLKKLLTAKPYEDFENTSNILSEDEKNIVFC